MELCEFLPLWADFSTDFLPYAEKRLGEETAQDAMQETYLRMQKLLPRYRHTAPNDAERRKAFFGFMHMVLSRVCHEVQRRESAYSSRHLPMPANATLMLAATDDTEGDALEVLITDDERSLLNHLIETTPLPPLQRAILLSHLRGESAADIAFRLAMTEANIRANLSCAVRQLTEAARVDSI